MWPGRDREIPTQSVLISSCLPADRFDPAEDQRLRWAQERSTWLLRHSPVRERGGGRDAGTEVGREGSCEMVCKVCVKKNTFPFMSFSHMWPIKPSAPRQMIERAERGGSISGLKSASSIFKSSARKAFSIGDLKFLWITICNPL